MKMRIPANTEYDALVMLTDGDDTKMHWKDIFSWVNDTENEFGFDLLTRAFRGFHSPGFRSSGWVTSLETYLGFRPACELGIDTLPPDIKAGDLVVIGTLYMDGLPVKVPQDPAKDGDITDYIPGAKLEMLPALSNTTYQVTGIYIGNGVAVADRALLKNISYRNLEVKLRSYVPNEVFPYEKVVITYHGDGSKDNLDFGIIVRTVSPDLDIVPALKAAAREYCETPEGKAYLADSFIDNFFDYGAFVDLNPEELCKKHGFYIERKFTPELAAPYNKI